MDFNRLASNLDLEYDEFYELLELFILTADGDFEKIKTAFSGKDARLLYEASHTLKGSAGNLGFEEISDIARGIEESARRQVFDGVFDKIVILEEQLGRLQKHVRLPG